MSNSYFLTLLRTALLLAAGSALVPACGGSAEFTADKSGSAGGAGQGGGATGGSASGGSTTGGSDGCANVNCLLIECGPGFKSVPAGCCSTCVPDGSGGSGGGTVCNGVACTAIACGPGYKSVLAPGSCCPTCVPDGSAGSGGGSICGCPPIACAPGTVYHQEPDECCGTCILEAAACMAGQKEYQDLRTQLLSEPGLRTCVKDNDCRLLGSHPYCGDSCEGTPVNGTAAASIGQKLSAFETANCSTCKPILAPCAPPFPPSCVAGQCMVGAFE